MIRYGAVVELPAELILNLLGYSNELNVVNVTADPQRRTFKIYVTSSESGHVGRPGVAIQLADILEGQLWPQQCAAYSIGEDGKPKDPVMRAWEENKLCTTPHTWALTVDVQDDDVSYMIYICKVCGAKKSRRILPSGVTYAITKEEYDEIDKQFHG